jgi:hypothetical protein
MSKARVEDATEELAVYVKGCHILDGRRKDRRRCMIARSALMSSTLGVVDIRVDRNIIKVLFADSPVWRRYQATPTMRQMVAAYDRATVQALHKLGALNIPEEGIRMVMRPPRAAISLKRMRSAAFKAMRKESARRRKGKTPRPHRRPDTLTLEDIRTGQGLGVG